MSWFRLKKGKRIIALTEEHDRIISQEITAQIKKQKSFVNNPEKEAKLHNIAEKVTSTLHKKIEIKIYIVQDDTVNTGLPDGIVFINSGTLKNLKDDNMLAAIIAHEYGHSVARHEAENITKMLMQKAGEVYVSEYAKNITDNSLIKGSLLTAGYVPGSKIGFVLPYSRAMEYEADKLGIILLSASGYNPKSMLDLMKYFEKMDDGENFPFELHSSVFSKKNKTNRKIYFK